MANWNSCHCLDTPIFKVRSFIIYLLVIRSWVYTTLCFQDIRPCHTSLVVFMHASLFFYVYLWIKHFSICVDNSESDLPITDDQITVASSDESHEDISRVCLGGTFDRLHYGHKILLTVGALLAKEHLLVGVTCSDLLSSKCLSPLIFSWEKRSKIVQTFLSDIGVQSKITKIVKLSDKFGPPGYSSEFDCIVASSDSLDVSCFW